MSMFKEDDPFHHLLQLISSEHPKGSLLNCYSFRGEKRENKSWLSIGWVLAEPYYWLALLFPYMPAMQIWLAYLHIRETEHNSTDIRSLLLKAWPSLASQVRDLYHHTGPSLMRITFDLVLCWLEMLNNFTFQLALCKWNPTGYGVCSQTEEIQ